MHLRKKTSLFQSIDSLAPELAERLEAQSDLSCDHATVLFQQALLQLPNPRDTMTVSDKLDILIEQLRINIDRIDEYRGILHTRRHLAATPIFKGIPDFRQTRIAMLRANTLDELLPILEACRQRLSHY